MKNLLKRILLRTMPGLTAALQAALQRRRVRNFERRLGLPEIAAAYQARCGLTVAGGPFVGMTYIPAARGRFVGKAYVPNAVGSRFVPKLLGSYESELHGVLEEIVHTDYDTIINIGCAEGYYVVGLARRIPAARIYAFDTDARARLLCGEMSTINGVASRVIIAGKCDAANLHPLISKRTLIVCDCEGYEIHLLCPDLAPATVSADILVELHDTPEVPVTRIILERYRETHQIEIITSVARNPADYPALSFLPPRQQDLAVSELRGPGQEWAYMKALDNAEGR
jgi:hypothetical protein